MSVFYKVEGPTGIAPASPSNLMLMLAAETSDRPILAQKPVYTTAQAPHQRCSGVGVTTLPVHCISRIPVEPCGIMRLEGKAAGRRVPALQGSRFARTRHHDLRGSGSRLPGYEIGLQYMKDKDLRGFFNPDDMTWPNYAQRSSDAMIDTVKELRLAHNRIRYLEDRLELVSNDGRRLSEDCDGIACRDDTIKLLDERIERLKADLSVARQSLYEVAQQRNALLNRSKQ